ncbi:MAG: hypothetical protein IV100_32900 [Myxococcales bacterium]|nr:hypothetical protein [Myxococcales bacterium]
MRTTFETTDQLSEFIASIAPEDFHAKRVPSLSNATLGVLHAGALTIHAIGRGLAFARGLDDKHTVKQVDRLLSNFGFDVERFRKVSIRLGQLGTPRRGHEWLLGPRLRSIPSGSSSGAPRP